MKRVLSNLKYYKKETVLGPLFKLFEALLELLVPLIVSYIIDKGIKADTPNKKMIIAMSILLIVVALIGFVFSIIAQFFNAKAAVGLSSKLRKNVYSKIQGLSYLQLDEIGTSSLITIMTNDVNQVQVGVNLTLRLFLRSPIVVFGALIMAFLIDVNLALIFLGVILLLLLVVLGIMFICIPLYKKVQNRLDEVTLSTRENLVGARVIRAFAKEKSEIEEFKNKNRDLVSSQKIVGFVSSLMNPLTYVIVNFGIILLIYFGAIKVDGGVLSQGNIVALYNYLSIILVELIKLANLVITINKSIACGHRIDNILSLNPNLKYTDEKVDDSSFIEYRNVSLQYNIGSDEKALENINFKVEKGQIIGIIGGTGSGKTSIINLLPHFYDVTEGKVILDGKNVNSYNDEELRMRFGIVPQKAVLFRGTIRSNLLWGNANASENDLIEALEVSQAMDFVSKKEGGIDGIVEQNGANFSGGQKQRLSIARALTRKPEILILDDSTSALDYLTDFKLRSAIRKLSYKPTVFIVSQRTSSIQDADLIIVLDEGKIVGKGTHEELLNSCVEYQEIYYSQVRKEEKHDEK